MIKIAVCSPFPCHIRPQFLRVMGLNSKKRPFCPRWSPSVLGGGRTLKPFIHAVFMGVVRVVRVKSIILHMCARAHTYEALTISLLN